MDALHVLVGLLIFALAALLFRRSPRSPLPWFTLLALELCNEAYDLHAELWPNRASQYGEGAKDILLTMALPTFILLLARWRQQLPGGESLRPVNPGRGGEPDEGRCRSEPSAELE